MPFTEYLIWTTCALSAIGVVAAGLAAWYEARLV